MKSLFRGGAILRRIKGGFMKRIVPLVLGILLVASFAIAAPPPPPPPGAPALDEYLNLTDSQKAAARSIESDFRAQTESLHEQMRALQEQLMAARKAADAKLETILTSEQKVKFEAFLAAMESFRKGGPGGGAHP
jgi:heavy-metal resistance protein